MPKQQKPDVNWSQVLDNLSTGQGEAQFFFPKKESNQVRFVSPEGEKQPFRPITTYWKGEPKTKYMVLGYIPELDELRGVVITTTAFRSLVALLADGWDMFSVDEGYGATIRRDQQGKRITYTVSPSRSPVPLPDHIKEALQDKDLDSLVEEWNRFQERRNQADGFNGGGKDEDSNGDWD